MAGDNSTNSKPKSKRGGARPGAGRKRLNHQSPTALAEIDLKTVLNAPVPTAIEDAAQPRAMTALSSLVRIVVSGAGDQARVSAANAVLDRGYGRPAVDAGGTFQLALEELPRLSLGREGELRLEARKYANLAIEVLHRIATASPVEGARVSASRSLLDRGFGTVAPAKLPDELTKQLGKREQASEDARAAATGIFAPPPPPGGLQ